MGKPVFLGVVQRIICGGCYHVALEPTIRGGVANGSEVKHPLRSRSCDFFERYVVRWG
jgi:hypothetical protein